MSEYNAADEAQIKEHEKKQKSERDQELDDIKLILNTPFGMRFFRRLFLKGRMFQTNMTGNSNTFFLEGHRNLVLEFFGDVCEACPDKISKLVTIQKQED